MKKIEIIEELFGILTLLKVFCEHTSNEEITVIKPSINHARQLADNLWYMYIRKD